MDTSQTLYDQLLHIIRTDTEARARKFFADHYNEFPEDVQKEILLGFFEEAMASKIALNDFKDEVVEAAQELQKDKRELEDAKEISTIKKKLSEK